MKINGFIILRLPQKNYIDPYTAAGRINGKYYGGYYRLGWEEIDFAFWEKTLPDDILTIYKSLRSDWNRGIEPELCLDIDVTERLLEYSNSSGVLNEISAISCPLFEEKIFVEDEKLIFRGYDIVGGGARMDLGIYFKPNFFEKFIGELNDYGLFRSNAICLEYIEHYKNIVAQTGGNILEDCSINDPIEIAEIYSFKGVS